MKKILLSMFALLAINLSVNAQATPSYTATASSGEYAEWSSLVTVMPTASNLKVEVYGSDSVIVRSWCGVEGYDICVTLDESGNAATAYPIVNGVANPYGNGGYWYLDTGLSDPNPWIAAAYIGTGYASVWSDETTKSGGIILSCYAYYDANYTSSAWGYYFCGWGSYEPATDSGTKPTFTAAAACGEYADWSSVATVIPAASNLNVEVYGTDSIIVRSWCGVEGYDICVTFDESGSGELASAYPIVNGVANPYGNGGYWYLDTGLTDPNPWIAAAYIGTGYSSAWNDDATQSGGIILSSYAYYDSGYTKSAWGYYYCGWGSYTPTGIETVTTNAANANVPMYNLAGQRVGDGAKGLVIKNGKKMILK